MTSRYITLREAKKVLNVSEATLRRWADEGLCPSIRSPGGKRLFAVSEYISNNCTGTKNNKQHDQDKKENKQSICYCRVSSQGQKDDLQRQVDHMLSRFPNHRIVTDIGSGINFKRKGLRSILELSAKGMVSEVVVAYRDRLCRFAFELLEWFFHLHGVRLVVLHESMDASSDSELAEDLLAIVNVFNCRVNGRRKYSGTGGKGKESPGEKGQRVEKVQEASGQQVQEDSTVSVS